MCPRPDAEIVAEAPVVQIVPALVAWTRMRRCFVMNIAGGDKLGVDEVLDIRREFVVGKLRWMTMKQGVRLDRQMIKRQMWGREAQRLGNIGARIREILSGQRIHQVKIDVAEDFNCRLRRRASFLSVVNATKRL